MLNIGTQAPDFTAALGSGERFSLSLHRGRKVVLYFYPRAFTHGCTIEAKGFRDAYDEIASHNAIVVGISTDDVDTLQRFGDACAVPFGLGSNATGEIRRLYDVQRRFSLGTSRVTYVIDTQGVIRGVFHNEIQMSSHIQKTLRTLESIG